MSKFYYMELLIYNHTCITVWGTLYATGRFVSTNSILQIFLKATDYSVHKKYQEYMSSPEVAHMLASGNIHTLECCDSDHIVS